MSSPPKHWRTCALLLLATAVVGCGRGLSAEASPATQQIVMGTDGEMVAASAPAPASSKAAPDGEQEPASEFYDDTPPPPVSGVLNQANVQTIVRKHFDKVADCYQQGLARDPEMRGTIEMRLGIGGNGLVVAAAADKDPKPRQNKSSDDPLTDEKVVSCVEGVFKRLRFPATNRGLVNMVYPVVLQVQN